MKKVHISSKLFIQNRKNLIGQLAPQSVAIITANDELTRSGDQQFPFRQNSDLFYLTGIEQEKCILVVAPQHPDKKLREVLFAIKPNEMIETWTGHKYTVSEIQKISGIQTVKWLDDFDLTIRDIILSSDSVYLNLNEYAKYLPQLVYQDQLLINDLKEKFPLHKFRRLAPILTQLRLTKDVEEISLLQRACDITKSAFHRILRFVKPGVNEYQVEAEIIHEFISRGGKGAAYQPIIGSGENALVLHYIENSDVCKDGDLLLMDFGAEYGNYAADCSRTIPVNGKFSPRQKECYEAVLRVQKEAIGLFVPGNTIDKINKKVWAMMEKEMIGLGLFTQEEVDKQDPNKPLFFQYLMHGVTHFIGLDVHDVGNKYQEFEKGMVLTIEPGIYIKEEGFGIRIEDNIKVDDNPINLMADIPKEVDEIEKIMSEK